MRTKFTPKDIVEEKLFFFIPLYQRLFEWEKENIVVLFDDLYRAFTLTPLDDYYIGMLTSTADNDLVDGQQRFTVMILMGCVFYRSLKNDNWGKFISPSEPRLRFRSRPKDMAFFKQAMNDESIWITNSEAANTKMKQGLDAIYDYIKKKVKPDERDTFVEFIYNHMCFFISYLPNDYSARNLNKYFERMNSTGKNLEQHEILKVKLLRNLDGELSPYMNLWNKLSEVNYELVQKRKDENQAALDSRRGRILYTNIDTIFREQLISGIGLVSDDNEPRTLRDIALSEKRPQWNDSALIQNSKSPLTFPAILLLTLYWKLQNAAKEEDNVVSNLSDFFNTANLLETFERYLPFEGEKVDKAEISDFIYRLIKVRLTLDYCFIRDTDFGYSVEMADNSTEEGKKLMMLESMIFVGCSRATNYKWFNILMNEVVKSNKIPDVNALYRALKDSDDKEYPLPLYTSLSYGADIRNYFWRLDFHIWSHRKELFKDDPNALDVAERYRFVRNRSIEHVAPQTPLKESNLKWDEKGADRTLMHSFGNLVMISNGLNSALKNQPFEIKKAYVESYIHGSINGSIESLSLLLIFTKYTTWTKDYIKNYGEYAYKLLQESYGIVNTLDSQVN